MAENLPSKSSANVTIVSAFAVGPTLNITAMWNFTSDQISERVKATGKPSDEFYGLVDSQAKASVCGSPEMAAFVRLGGTVRHFYKSNDGVPLRTITMDNCPR